jgi:hypothetical protein
MPKGKITDEMWKDFEEIIHDIVELSVEHPDGWRGVKADMDERLKEADDYHIGELFNWYGAEYPDDNKYQDDDDDDDDDDDSDIEYGGESGEES